MVNRHQIAQVLGLSLLYGFFTAHSLAVSPKPRKLNWQTNIYAAHKISVKEQKPMLLVFHAEWCGYCRKLEGTTLADPRIVSYINSSFVPVHLDLDKQKRIAKILDVKSVPCSVVLSPDADLLGKLVGYVEAARFQKTLESTRRIHTRIQQTRRASRQQPPGRKLK